MKIKIIDIDYVYEHVGTLRLEAALPRLAQRVKERIKDGWQPVDPPIETSEGAWIQKIVKYESRRGLKKTREPAIPGVKEKKGRRSPPSFFLIFRNI